MIGVCWRFSVVFLDFRLLSNLDIVNCGIYLALLYFGHCQYSNINVACSRMWNKISRCWKYSMSTTSDLFTRSASSDALKLTCTALRSASFGLQGAPPVRQQLGGRLPPFSSTNLEPTKSWWLDKPQHCSWEREESSAGTRFNPQALSLRVEPFKPNYSVVRACEEKMSANLSLCFVVRLYSEQICIHCVAFTRSGNRKVFNHWKPPSNHNSFSGAPRYFEFYKEVKRMDQRRPMLYTVYRSVNASVGFYLLLLLFVYWRSAITSCLLNQPSDPLGHCLLFLLFVFYCICIS